MVELKVGSVKFSFKDNFSGEVKIERGDNLVSVPIGALQTMVAEKVRHALISKLEDMSAGEILSLSPAKK